MTDFSAAHALLEDSMTVEARIHEIAGELAASHAPVHEELGIDLDDRMPVLKLLRV
jgi:hypothetical protein